MRDRYIFFVSKTKKEGYQQIANVFTETASNDKEHAEVYSKYLEGDDVEITAAYRAGIIGDTQTNLKAAADGEEMESREFTQILRRSPEKKAFIR